MRSHTKTHAFTPEHLKLQPDSHFGSRPVLMLQGGLERIGSCGCVLMAVSSWQCPYGCVLMAVSLWRSLRVLVADLIARSLITISYHRTMFVRMLGGTMLVRMSGGTMLVRMWGCTILARMSGGTIFVRMSGGTMLVLMSGGTMLVRMS